MCKFCCGTSLVVGGCSKIHRRRNFEAFNPIALHESDEGRSRHCFAIVGCTSQYGGVKPQFQMSRISWTTAGVLF